MKTSQSFRIYFTIKSEIEKDGKALYVVVTINKEKCFIALKQKVVDIKIGDFGKGAAKVARNACRMSKDDVALALNHIDEGHRTTDIYIAKDWCIVDEIQHKVVFLLRNRMKKK